MYAALLKYLMIIQIKVIEDNEMSFATVILNLDESEK